jgi:hypothetical protein
MLSCRDEAAPPDHAVGRSDDHQTARRAPLGRKNWFVYAKPPPERLSKGAGPEAVLAYLARYTHRVAISNRRLVGLDERGVTFRYKDDRRNGRARHRTMTITVPAL